MPYINGSIIENFVSLSWEVEKKSGAICNSHVTQDGQIACIGATLSTRNSSFYGATNGDTYLRRKTKGEIRISAYTTRYEHNYLYEMCKKASVSKRFWLRKGFGFEKGTPGIEKKPCIKRRGILSEMRLVSLQCSPILYPNRWPRRYEATVVFYYKILLGHGSKHCKSDSRWNERYTRARTRKTDMAVSGVDL